jgi:hypothetical protein
MTNISILYIESLHINVIYYSVYLNEPAGDLRGTQIPRQEVRHPLT